VVDKASPGDPYALFLVSAETGEKTRLTSPAHGYGDGNPAVSPDGDVLQLWRTAVGSLKRA
jgi:hypothetical protein